MIMDNRKYTIEKIKNILERRGVWSDLWYDIDKDIQDEITDELVNILPIHDVISYNVDKSTVEKEEFYGEWCECPKCGNKNVIYKSKHCSSCGVRLNY